MRWRKSDFEASTFHFNFPNFQTTVTSLRFRLEIFPDRQNDRTDFLSTMVGSVGVDLLYICITAPGEWPNDIWEIIINSVLEDPKIARAVFSMFTDDSETPRVGC